MMRRLLINSFSFAVGILLAAAMLLPAYATAGGVQLKGQSGISNGKFGFGGANPTTTYTVGQTTIRDVTDTGTDVTVGRETPFEGRNKYGDKAMGRVIDAFKVPKAPLTAGLKSLFKGGLVGIGGSILMGWAIEKGWQLLNDAQCEVSSLNGCFQKNPIPDARFSAEYDVLVWQTSILVYDTNPPRAGSIQPQILAYRFRNTDMCSLNKSPWTGCTASQISILDSICKSIGFVQVIDGGQNCLVPNGKTTPLILQTAPSLTPTRPLSPVMPIEIDSMVDSKMASSLSQPQGFGVIDELSDAGIAVEATNTNTTALAAPMQTPERTLSTTSTANPDGSVDTNTSKGKTIWTISPTGEITMKDVITDTESHTTPEGQTSTGSTTSTETPNQTDPDTPPADQPALPADPAMPTVPELYKQKYEDGLTGVWNDKKDEFMNSEFIQSIKSLAPEGLDSGTCPQWSLGFDMGVANYGEQSLPFPCWLAPFLKAVMMLTAAFTARKILWG